MDLDMITLSEVKSEKDEYHILLIWGIYNMTQMNLSMKNKQTHRDRDQTGGCQGGGPGERRSGRPGLADGSVDI